MSAVRRVACPNEEDGEHERMKEEGDVEEESQKVHEQELNGEGDVEEESQKVHEQEYIEWQGLV
jgi:hypothetical protein